MPPDITTLTSDRLVLEPVGAAHADEMVAVLAPVELYAFTGGEPPTSDILRDRFTRRSPDPAETWCMWIARRGGAAVGYAQATVRHEPAEVELAWVLGPPWQGRGLATEMAGTVMAWLAEAGWTSFVAHVHPDHVASQAVARRLGMSATGARQDDEEQWARRT